MAATNGSAHYGKDAQSISHFEHDRPVTRQFELLTLQLHLVLEMWV